MRIFITGGSGFLGKNLINNFNSKFEILYPNSKELNLTDKTQLNDFFSDNRFDWIINCAVKGGRRTRPETSEDFYNNVVSLGNLLSYTNDKSKLITFSSGAEIYKQNTFYGLSKKICTNMIRGKNNIKNLRIYNLFGPFGMKDSFVYSTIKKCLRDEEIVIWEDHLFDIYSVENLISIIDMLIKDNTNKYEEIDCVHKDKYKLSDLAKMIKDFCGSKSKIIIQKQKETNYTGNYEEQINFKPITLEKTLYDFIEFIKDETV